MERPPTYTVLHISVQHWWNLAQLYHCDRKFKKCINHVSHQKLAIFVISSDTYKNCIVIHFFNFFLTFIDSSWVVLTMTAILMLSAKWTTPGFFELKVFWNNGYELILSVQDVTSKILLYYSDYTEAKFGNSSISTRETIITSFV